jgi:hypothetical protein
MWEDPIVNEVRAVRDKLAARFNYDVDAIFDDLQRRQASLGDRLVFPKNRKTAQNDVQGTPQPMPPSVPDSTNPVR